jgi:tetratricopeptide (TPR) repeat protein
MGLPEAMSIENLAERISQRTAAYFESHDVANLIGTAVEREAAALWLAIRELDARPGVTLDDEILFSACVSLGWLHYLRHTAIKGEPGWPELARAVVCLAPWAEEPDVVPSSLEQLLGPAADPDAQAGFAVGFLTRSQQSGDPALLDAGIELLISAAAALPDNDPDRGTRLSNLCLALRNRFKRDATTGTLDDSIAAGEQAVAIPGMHELDPVGPRFNLAYAYWDRFRHGGEPADLVRAIGLLEDVAAACRPGPERSEWLTEVAQACGQLYEHTGDLASLKRAIGAAEQAVAALPHDPKEAAAAVFTLAVLLCHHQQTGGTGDLRRVKKLATQCLAMLPSDHPDRPGYLADVAGLCMKLHSAGADVDGLRTAVQLSEQAMAARPDDPSVLTVLVEALQEHYRFGGSAADLDRAIALGRRATEESPDHHRLRAALAGAYTARYQFAGAQDDLGQAIALLQVLLAGTAGGRPERAGWASLLGNAYQQRFTSCHDLADLDRAIHFGEQAVAAASPDDPALGDRLGKLAIAYQRGHDVGADPGHRSRAIELGERAVAATPKGHPDRGGWLSNLALAYLTPGYTAEPTRAELDRAVELSEQSIAADPGRQPDRVRLVANLAAAYRDRMAAGGQAVAAQRVHELAQQVSQTDAAPADRVWGHHATGTLAQVADENRLAVQLLDTAITLLPDAMPREAGWADQQYRLGEHTGLIGSAIAAHCAMNDPAGAVEVAEQGRGVLLSSQFAARISATDRKRTHPAQPRLADLAGATAGGSVVLVNAGRYRGDAVILRAESEPMIVELPGLHQKQAQERAIALGEDTAGTLPEILGWLWDTVAGPVLAALPARPSPHRIWWLPTGFLSVFPLHAAGHPGQTGALDAAISSFIPSLRTLQRSRTRAAPSARQQLVVSLEHTPGLPDLPGTAREAAELHASHPGTSLGNAQATVSRVLTALPEATWAHFACHARADLLSPADSGLWLHDGPLRLPEIGALHLPHAELAYLSACSTADHGGRYADETLDIASAFHLAGFRHVIASLWPLNDQIAMQTASAFYRELPDLPSADTAASTLHRVIHTLRTAKPDRPDLWAAMIHSGP